MGDVIKKYVWYAVLITAAYFLLTYHFVIIDHQIVPMKKIKRTFSYTVFNSMGKSPEYILAIDSLRKAGIGELMAERGVITYDKLDDILDQYDEEYEGDDTYQEDDGQP